MGPPQLSAEQLGEMSKAELNELAKTFDIPTPVKVKKDELVAQILESQAQRSGIESASGVLDILPEGYGFLRREGYLLGVDDIYISQSQIRRFELRRGDLVAGQVRRPKDNEKYYGIVKVETVNGYDPESIRARRTFEDLNAVVPSERWKLALKGDAAHARARRAGAARQRPARAGHGAAARRPGVDARRDRLGDSGQFARRAPDRPLDRRPARRRRHVAASHRLRDRRDDVRRTSRPSRRHGRTRHGTCEALVELGSDVVIVLDSLTRLARAFGAGARKAGRSATSPPPPNRSATSARAARAKRAAR